VQDLEYEKVYFLFELGREKCMQRYSNGEGSESDLKIVQPCDLVDLGYIFDWNDVHSFFYGRTEFELGLRAQVPGRDDLNKPSQALSRRYCKGAAI
jgi:hypothetical protein